MFAWNSKLLNLAILVLIFFTFNSFGTPTHVSYQWNIDNLLQDIGKSSILSKTERVELLNQIKTNPDSLSIYKLYSTVARSFLGVIKEKLLYGRDGITSIQKQEFEWFVDFAPIEPPVKRRLHEKLWIYIIRHKIKELCLNQINRGKVEETEIAYIRTIISESPLREHKKNQALYELQLACHSDGDKE